MATPTLLVALAVIPFALAACGEPDFERGADVNIAFTDACAPGYCWFGQPMVRGGSHALRITHVRPGDFDFRDTRLVSSAPDVAAVIDYRPTADDATARIAVFGIGSFALMLTDGEHVLASAATWVRIPDDYVFTVDAAPPGAVVTYADEVLGFGPHYTVAADTIIGIAVHPYGGGDPLYGAVQLAIDVNDARVPPEQALAPFDPDELAAGRFTVAVTAGTHDLFVTAVGTGGRTGGLRLTGL